MVDLVPLWDVVLNTSVAVITTVAVASARYFIKWLSTKTDLINKQAESVLAERIDYALHAGIGYAEAWVKSKIADPESPIRSIQIDNIFVEMAAKYVINSVPDSLRSLNITPDRVKEMVLSRLNRVMALPEVDSGEVKKEG